VDGGAHDADGFPRRDAEAEPAARLGDDPEGVHDMRVAIRRVRDGLRMFRKVLGPWTDGARHDLGWLGAGLGRVRDLDVEIDQLRRERQAETLEPAIRVLERERNAARDEMLAALDSGRTRAMLDQLAFWARADRSPTASGGQSVRVIAQRRIGRLHRRYATLAGRIGSSSSADDVHQARIRAKHLRYASELLESGFGEPARRFVRSLSAAQDILGAHQDARVSAERLEELVRGNPELPPSTGFALGDLACTRRGAMGDLRRQFPPVNRKLERRWRKFRTAIG
jgi:CHAD domain-containing protein